MIETAFSPIAGTNAEKGGKKMFKLLYTNERGAQGDFLVSPTLVAEAGMLGTLQGTSSGSPTGLPQVILASASSNVIGVIDENKTTQFIATVIDEAIPTGSAVNLNNANVVLGTFSQGTATATLTSATNGVVSCSAAGNVSYSYVIPGKAGDDTTLASGKCTLWLQEGEYATDVYEVATTSSGSIAYNVGDKLWCSAGAKLTATVPANLGTGSTVVGYVTKSPSAGNPFLHFYLRNDISRA
jgi:hypothetical protein